MSMIDLRDQFVADFNYTMRRLARELRHADPAISDRDMLRVQLHVGIVMWRAHRACLDHVQRAAVH